MQHVLFVANILDIPDIEAWNGLMLRVEPKLKQERGVSQLGANVWLLDLNQSTVALATLILHVHAAGIEHRILPFEHEPRWLPAGPDPKAT